MKRLVLLVVCFMLFLAPEAKAHPGGTDSSGGHYDRSTGSYHYHHGYSAHEHPGGVCPYDYKDKTGASSGSGLSSFNIKATAKPTIKPTVKPAAMITVRPSTAPTTANTANSTGFSFDWTLTLSCTTLLFNGGDPRHAHEKTQSIRFQRLAAHTCWWSCTSWFYLPSLVLPFR